MKAHTRWKTLLRDSPYAVLIGLTVAMFAVLPIFDATGGPLLSLMFALVALAAMSSIYHSRKAFIVGAICCLPSVVADIADIFGRFEGAERLGRHSIMVFDVLVLWVIFRDLFRQREVAVRTLLGAVCGYIWLGFVFGHVYELIGQYDPEAFVYSSEQLFGTRGRAYYFSFVTLTTLGFGDMVPVTPLTQGYAVLEALTGQLYLAIVIARMVGVVGSGVWLPRNDDDTTD